MHHPSNPAYTGYSRRLSCMRSPELPKLASLHIQESLTQWSEDSDPFLQDVIESMAETITDSSGDHELVLIPLLQDFFVGIYDRWSFYREEAEVGFVNSNFVYMLKVRLDCASPPTVRQINASTRLLDLRFTEVDDNDIEQLVKWRDENKFEELAIHSGRGSNSALHRVV